MQYVKIISLCFFFNAKKIFEIAISLFCRDLQGMLHATQLMDVFVNIYSNVVTCQIN